MSPQPTPITRSPCRSPYRRAITPLSASQEIADLAERLARLAPSPPPPQAAAAAASTSDTVQISSAACPQFWTHVESMAPRPSTMQDYIQLRCEKALKYIAKCRYDDMLPCDKNLVALQYTQDEGESFINANWIEKTLVTQGPLLVTQGPKQSTVNDFWIMLLEQKIRAVCCLTPHYERGKEKTALYWQAPLADDRIHGQKLQVTAIRDEPDTTKIVQNRTFKISFGDKEHIVEHFLYLGWPDFGVCQVETLVQLLLHMRSLDEGRFACHCSAGMGRAGVVAALNIVIEEFLKTKNAVTMAVVAQAVLTSRIYRPNSVMTPDQFRLLVDAVQYYLRSLDVSPK